MAQTWIRSFPAEHWRGSGEQKFKKKLQTSLGKVEVPKVHVLMNAGGKFNISSFMQEQMCFMGQQKVFEEGAESFQRFMGIEVNAKQIERICHYYGDRIEQIQQQAIRHGGKDKKNNIQYPYYAMVDGGMLLTREEKWKEMKLGRIFKTDEAVEISKGRRFIANSLYVAHLGKHEDFIKKVEYHLDSVRNKIFIADGARWIWGWATAAYPDARQVLDFYHAKEHLCQFALMAIPSDIERKAWVEKQSDLLLENHVEQVISNLKRMSARKPMVNKTRKNLIDYYETNKHRMQYKSLRDEGLLIGSGPIEAAHRNVIQQRMKLSGQRWTMNGAQQMANLRVAYKSRQWNKVTQLIKKAA